MKKTPRILATVAAAVGFTLVALGAAAPAHAGRNDCPLGYVCIWKDSAYHTNSLERAYVKFQYYIHNYAEHQYEGTSIGSANTATSIFNNGRYDTAFMYASSFKRTQLFEIPAGNSNWSLNGVHGDNIESGYYSTYH